MDLQKPQHSPDAPAPAERAPSETVAGFFRAQLDELATDESVQRVALDIEEVAHAVRLVPEAPGRQVLGQVLTVVLRRLSELMDIHLIEDVLAQAWSHYDALQDYCDPAKYPPEELFKAVLVLEHTITSTHEPSFKPVVSILGREIEFAEIAFPIGLELLVKGGEIGIRDAHIVSISVGSCHVTGQLGLKYGDGAERVLAKRESPLSFEHVHVLKTPVPLRRSSVTGG